LIADAKVLLIFESANEKRKKMPNTPNFSVKSPLLGVVHGSIGAKNRPIRCHRVLPFACSRGVGRPAFLLVCADFLMLDAASKLGLSSLNRFFALNLYPKYKNSKT